MFSRTIELWRARWARTWPARTMNIPTISALAIASSVITIPTAMGAVTVGSNTDLRHL